MKLHKLFEFKRFRLIALILFADVLFFSLVNPVSNYSFVTIIGSVLLAATLYLFVRFAIRVIAIFLPMSASTQKRAAVFATVLLVFLVLMQSIGQLSLRDVLAVVPLAVVMYLYLGYATGSKSDSKPS